MSKAQIVREGARLGVDYSLTVSCYQADAEGAACGSVIPAGYGAKALFLLGFLTLRAIDF
jgi:7-cyano-7-deazaguanine synthase in queuosine biosynthesis